MNSRDSALARWGRLVGRHPWRVLAVWLVLVVAGFGLAGGAAGESLFSRLHSGSIRVPGESQSGSDALADAGSTVPPTYTLLVDGVALDAPETATAAAQAAQVLGAVPDVAEVASPFTVPGGVGSAAGRALVAPDGRGFATVVTFGDGSKSATIARARPAMDAAFDTLVRDTGAVSSERGGVRQLLDAVIGQIKTDMQRGEGVALPVTFVVMVVVFGGFLAAGLPLLGAIASIAGALGTLLGFSYLIDLDATVVNIVTVLGLGLCIDYGLLVVSRFREELRGRLRRRGAGHAGSAEVLDAVGATLDRAGRTVLFSGLTVALSMAGLLFFQADIMRAIGAAGVSVVILAMLVALTLVPALCALSPRRLLRRGTEIAPENGLFSRLAAVVQRAPWAVIVIVLGVLGVAAVPASSMRLTASGAELLPVQSPQRTFFDTLAADYPALAAPQVLVVTGQAESARVESWVGDAAKLPGVLAVTGPTRVGDLLTVGLRTSGTGLAAPARDLTDRLRTDRPPFPAYVVGQASALDDFVAAAKARAPYAVGSVALATLVLLFLMTGSVVIPVKALVMNVLSLGASLGLVTWIFQDGHGESLLRFSSVGALEQVIPLLVLAFGFGLSMDYEVFLLSRIVELHESGYDTSAAVRLGLQRSGRIITSAAVLMVIVFAGFVSAQVLVIKQTGVALVLAVALDATLVRMLLVPATMTVLGSANWWAPAPLRRLHERFGVRE